MCAAWAVVPLYGVVWKGLTEKMAYKQRHEGSERARHAGMRNSSPRLCTQQVYRTVICSVIQD